MLKGIDVSTLQGNIDWTKVSADFAMIKATQGRGEGAATRLLSRFTDSKFKRNITSCRCPAGVYHYFTAQDKAKALSEVDYFYSIIEPYKSRIKLWAALDVESFYLDGLGKTKLTAIVRTALERIRYTASSRCFTRIRTTSNTASNREHLTIPTSGSRTGAFRSPTLCRTS